MKTPWLVIIVTFCFSGTLSAQFIQCNSNTNSNLNDVHFMDFQTGIAVGDSGTIIRSTDGGNNWTVIMGLDSVSFSKVDFFDQTNGLAVGTDIYRTSDAGQTWQKIAHTNTDFTDIEILNSTTCLLAGNPNRLLKSTDMGVTFTTLVGDTLENQLGLLSFINDTVGFACGFYQGYSNQTLKTIDGGASWTLIEDTINGYNPTVMMALSYISESVGFKAGWYNPHLQKTTNAGNVWTNCSSADPLFDPQLNDLHIDAHVPNSYMACGWYGHVYKSVDGGDSWSLLNSDSLTNASLNGIYFKDGSLGWIVGANGTVLKYERTIGIIEADQLPLSFYPNPTTGRIQLPNWVSDQPKKLRVYNELGQFVREAFIIDGIVDLRDLSNGIYVLEFQENGKQSMLRMVKLD